MKIPPGSQLPNGQLVPQGTEPQPDGFVLLPGGGRIPTADITLPDGVNLSEVVNPTGEVPTPTATMPDGSKPSKVFTFNLSQFTKPTLSGAALPSFNWGSGVKIPDGSQLPDGSPVPEDAEAQPDGSLKLPTGSVVPADDITLPEGIKLSGYFNPTAELPMPVATLPDGSKPSKKWSFRMPEVSMPSPPEFNWKVGMKIPPGSQLPDGKPVPEGAEPQPGGIVLLPGGVKIPTVDITLPEDIKLAEILHPTGEIPTPAPAMPDGSKPKNKFMRASFPQFSVPSLLLHPHEQGNAF